ncbi:MAG TPA: sensor histidine kinase [Acidimicrobiales bacterium]|nr:sensor histidine kinase [Acidimicrobiales bacterium]
MSNAFEHVAVFHDGPEDLARRTVPDLLQALDRGEAVLVCLDETAWGPVAAGLGDRVDEVTYVPAADRYAAPANAMAVLHRFVADAIARGAGAAWSLGALSFDGSDADRRWHHYEAAVNEVFVDVPLRGICSYDVRTTPRQVLDEAKTTHGLLVGCEGTEGRTTSPVYGRWAGDWQLPPVEAGAGATLLVALTAPTPAQAREAVGEALVSGEWVCPPDLVDDARLAMTEMVANALRHGHGDVTVAAWVESAPDVRVVLEVTDEGPGVSDPFAGLRPPGVGLGGYGLWLIGQLADGLWFGRSGARTVCRAALSRSQG